MKTIATAALGVLVLAGSAFTQEKPGQPPPVPETRRQCDLTRLENRVYCAMCQVYPEADQVEKDLHLKCQTKVETVPVCLKTAYQCKMHGDGMVLHARRCCPVGVKDCCIDLTVASRVEYKCDTCLKRSPKEMQVVHVNTKCPGKIVRTCEKSGTFPHGGEPTPITGAGPIEKQPGGVPPKDEQK
jgi:hypothetical protein